MFHLQVVVAGVALVVIPATASAQPEGFRRSAQALAQAAVQPDSSNNKVFAEAARQMAVALAQWDRDLRAQETQAAGELSNASMQRQYELHLTLGVAYRTRGRVEDALNEFDAAASLQPDASQPQRLRALTLESNGRSADAARAFHLAYSRDPVNPVNAYAELQQGESTPAAAELALNTLTQAYDQLRTTPAPPAAPPFEILDAIPDTLWKMPVVGDARTGPGFALLAAGKYTEAIASLSSIGEPEKGRIDGARARFLQAQQAEKDNRVSEARDGYTASLAGALAGRSFIYVAIGRLAQVEGDVPAAIEAFTQAVRLNPNEPLMRQELASAYAAAGRIDAAFAELVAGLLVDPGYAPLHIAIGQLRLDNGQPMDAIPALTRALELSPERYEVRYARSVALKRVGKVDEAAQELEQFERIRRQMLERRRNDIQADVDKEETIRRGLPSSPGSTP